MSIEISSGRYRQRNCIAPFARRISVALKRGEQIDFKRLVGHARRMNNAPLLVRGLRKLAINKTTLSLIYHYERFRAFAPGLGLRESFLILAGLGACGYGDKGDKLRDYEYGHPEGTQ